MQKASLIFLLFLTTAFSSCSYYEHMAQLQFYTQLSGTNDSLDKMTVEWHQLLTRAVAAKNFSGLAPCRIKIGEFMSRNRAKVANIELPPTAENIRDSEEAFLAARAIIVSEIYPTFEPFNDITPNEDIDGQLRLVADDQEKETLAMEAIKKSLQAFAQRNHLKILPRIANRPD